MASPLSVRIKSGSVDRHVTHEILSGPRFRSVVPGGFASCEFTISRPVGMTPQDIRHFAQVWVYSSQGVVWEGWIEDTGRSVQDDGEVWQIACVGPSAHLSDDVRPLIYSDSELTSERWQKGTSFSTKSAQVSLGDDNTKGPLIKIQAGEGEAVYGGGTVYGDMMYRAMYDAGLKLARVRATFQNAVTNSDYSNRIVTRQGPSGTGNNTARQSWSSGQVAVTAALNGFWAIPAGHDVCHIRWVRTASGDLFAQSDNYWLEAHNVNVRMQLKDKDGTDITSGYDLPSVRADEVVKDLLGRCLPLYDGANAYVETSAYNIDHLAYPGGISPKEVMDDLLEFEPGMYYAAWESNADGLYRFEFRAWPQEVRYEADLSDGFEGPSSAAEIYNKACIRYIDWRGRERTTTVTQSVPSLGSRSRTLHVDAGNEISSQANAQTIGQRQLEEHTQPPNMGSLTVGRPIYDRTLNRMVKPFEIMPGRLIRVRGIQPSIDSLNATVRDGVTVFKVVSVEYDADTGMARLELDRQSREEARYMSFLVRARKRRQARR